MLETPPRTRAGAAALIEFMLEYGSGWDDDAKTLLETLRRALPNLA